MRRGEGQHVGGTSSTRGDERAQQEHEHDEDDSEDRGDDDPQVAVGWRAHVEVLRGLAADEHRRGRPGRGRRAPRRTVSSAAGESAGSDEGRLHEHLPVDDLGGGCPGAGPTTRARDAVLAAEHRHDALGDLACRRDDGSGVPDPAGKCRASTSWPVTESTGVRKSVGLLDALGVWSVGSKAASAASSTSA